jgi:hypothetical protein
MEPLRRSGRPMTMGNRLSPCVALLIAGVIAGGSLAGCTGKGGSASSGRPSGSAATSVPAAPSETTPSASEPAGSDQSPSAGPAGTKPGGSTAPRTGEVTVTGGVEAGVEPGCRLLRTTDRLYLLIGGDRTRMSAGSRLTVRGQVEPDLMSTCQQGTPLRVLDLQNG